MADAADALGPDQPGQDGEERVQASAEADSGAEPLDFAANEPAPTAPAPELDTRPWSPDPVRERIRGTLALILVGAVIAEIAGAVAAVIAGVKIDDVRSLLEPTFGPLVALAGSAVGFYFAGHSSR